MAKFAWVGENYDNRGGSSSKGYMIRRSGRVVIRKWGPIEVTGGKGGKFYWLGSYPKVVRKRFRTEQAAAQYIARISAYRVKCGYDKLPGRVQIRPARQEPR